MILMTGSLIALYIDVTVYYGPRILVGTSYSVQSHILRFFRA